MKTKFESQDLSTIFSSRFLKVFEGISINQASSLIEKDPKENKNFLLYSNPIYFNREVEPSIADNKPKNQINLDTFDFENIEFEPIDFEKLEQDEPGTMEIEEQGQIENPEEKEKNEQDRLKQRLLYFLNTEHYQELKLQYEKLTSELGEWCNNHNCTEEINTGLEQPILDAPLDNPFKDSLPAFQLFYERLFDEKNFKDIGYYNEDRKGQILLFAEAKAILEKIYQLLIEGHLSTAEKKRIMVEVQNQISVCPAGFLTHIDIAQGELSATSNTEQIIVQVKEELAVEVISAYISLLFSNTPGGNHVHWANFYLRLVTTLIKELHIKINPDHFADAITIPESEPIFLKNFFSRMFTPSSVLFKTFTYLEKAFEQNAQDFKKEWEELAKEEKISFEVYSKIETLTNNEEDNHDTQNTSLQEIVETRVTEWNKKFGELCRINSNFFATLEDDGRFSRTQVSFIQLFSQFLTTSLEVLLNDQRIQTVTGQYFNTNSDLMEQITLYLKEGFYWAVDSVGDTVIPRLEFLLRLELSSDIPGQNTYFEILNQVLEANLSLEHEAFKLQIKDDLNNPNTHALLRERVHQYPAIAYTYPNIVLFLLEHQLISPKQFVEKLDLLPEKESLFWHLINQGQVDILDELMKFTESDWKDKQFRNYLNFSPVRGSSQGESLLWSLVKNSTNQFPQALFHYITSEDLNKKNGLGINLFQYILTEKKLSLIADILVRHLVTPEIINSRVPFGLYENINALWILAFHLSSKDTPIAVGYTTILEHLIKNFGTTENLAVSPNNALNNNQGRNIPWLIAQAKKITLLESIMDKLSFESVSACAERGFSRGVNLPLLLAYGSSFKVIEQLLEKKLIHKESLLAHAQNYNHKYYGQTLLKILIENKQWKLVEFILDLALTDEELIKLFEQSADHGIEENVTTLWFLLNAYQETLKQNPRQISFRLQQHIDRIISLWEPERFISILLSINPEFSPYQNINGTWLLVSSGYIELFNKLIDSQKISGDDLNFFPTCPSHPDYGKGILTLLIEQKRFDVVKKLLNQGLIRPSQLQSHIGTGEILGITVIEELAKQNQFKLIELFFKKGLITDLSSLSAESRCSGYDLIQYQNDPMTVEFESLPLRYRKLSNTNEKISSTLIFYEDQIFYPNIQEQKLVALDNWILDLINNFPLPYFITEPQKVGLIDEAIHNIARGEGNFSIDPNFNYGIMTARHPEGVTALWRMIHAKEYGLFSLFLQANLVTLEDLELPENNLFAKISILGMLAKDKQFGLIDRLLNQSLITQRFLNVPLPKELPQSRGKKIHLLDLFIENKQSLLIKQLWDRRLLKIKDIKPYVSNQNMIFVINSIHLDVNLQNSPKYFEEVESLSLENYYDAFMKILHLKSFTLLSSAWENPVVRSLNSSTLNKEFKEDLLYDVLSLGKNVDTFRNKWSNFTKFIDNYLETISDFSIIKDTKLRLEREENKKNTKLINTLDNYLTRHALDIDQFEETVKKIHVNKNTNSNLLTRNFFFNRPVKEDLNEVDQTPKQEFS